MSSVSLGTIATVTVIPKQLLLVPLVGLLAQELATVVSWFSEPTNFTLVVAGTPATVRLEIDSTAP